MVAFLRTEGLSFEQIGVFVAALCVPWFLNYWQGMVAKRFAYAAVLYLDAALVVLPLAVILFLQNRGEAPAERILAAPRIAGRKSRIPPAPTD